jgi:hypothetical protein
VLIVTARQSLRLVLLFSLFLTEFFACLKSTATTTPSPQSFSEPARIWVPTDEQLTPENFHFDNYGTLQRRMHVLKVLFPLGTKRDIVEETLIQKAGAHIDIGSSPKTVNYISPPPPDAQWHITITYNDKDEVIRVFVDGHDVNKLLYPDAKSVSLPLGTDHLMACLLSRCNPFKVIDPADPQFNPGSFRFEDYSTRAQMQYALQSILKSGMTRQQIDRILVKSGKASVNENRNGQSVYYYYPITNFMDIDGGVWAISASYKDMVHADKIWLYGDEITH